jgi:transcriptional regulator with XRE-family HTH domain
VSAFATLGKQLEHLRRIRGLALPECAKQLGVTRERLAAAERGEQIDAPFLQAFSQWCGIDEEALMEGELRAASDIGEATVFLLHGSLPDFDMQDIEALDRAMCVGRELTARLQSHGRQAAISRRLGFAPVPPAGPRPADAARQGHRLARMFRARMGLDGKPVEDIRRLLEEQLGIAVIVAPLVTARLEAASILDDSRVAATAILSSTSPQRSKNAVLARIHLAHEACHLLFDPGAPGRVCIALDEEKSSAGGVDGGAPSAVRLMESRAKGFAAELLIPLSGVEALLGAPSQTSAVAEARSRVKKTRDHFNTSWEIAAYHLKNLGYFDPMLVPAVVGNPEPGSNLSATKLPLESQGSLLLEALATTPSTDTVGTDAPPFVAAAREAGRKALDAEVDCALEEARTALAGGRPLDAVDRIVDVLDDLLHAGEIERVKRLLAEIDPGEWPPTVLTGMLMTTRPAREALGDARRGFWGNARSALQDVWAVDAEQIQGIERRLV